MDILIIAIVSFLFLFLLRIGSRLRGCQEKILGGELVENGQTNLITDHPELDYETNLMMDPDD